MEDIHIPDPSWGSNLANIILDLEKDIAKYTNVHNEFLKELGLDLLP